MYVYVYVCIRIIRIHSMYTYVCIRMYVYMYVCMYTYVCIRMYVYVCMYTYVCIRMYVYVCMYVCMHTYVCIRMYAYIGMYTYVYSMYVYGMMHTYIHTYIMIVNSIARPTRTSFEEVTPLAGCGAGTLPWGQRTTCSNKAGGVWEQDTWAKVPARANLATQLGALLHGYPWQCFQVAEPGVPRMGGLLEKLIYPKRLNCHLDSLNVTYIHTDIHT